MNNEFYTPPELTTVVRRVLGRVDLDPASCPTANELVGATRYFSAAEDGFVQPWHGRVYLNPPSGVGGGRRSLRQWWNKLSEEFLLGRVEAAIFCDFYLGLFSYPGRYLEPAAVPLGIVRGKPAWVRPDGRRYTPKTTCCFLLLTRDPLVVRQFAREFDSVAYVLLPPP